MFRNAPERLFWDAYLTVELRVLQRDKYCDSVITACLNYDGGNGVSETRRQS